MLSLAVFIDMTRHSGHSFSSMAEETRGITDEEALIILSKERNDLRSPSSERYQELPFYADVKDKMEREAKPLGDLSIFF